ncbi:uncharacterized protein LOC132725631 isoform X2 [Ruditapes philippinarum]|uniref:uncharacterized protein LOC132725631 isoform X2 n=1 Tax=Ruditapes philippinarum TaxID=129788 RepID=UPI00295AD435|nr:uncharacterized protein LOC132725631 isoform X2 [Ruditapes philippinarum]
MFVITLFKVILLYLTIFTKNGVECQQVQLELSAKQVTENESLTLTCSYTGTQAVLESTWMYSKELTKTSTLMNINETCDAVGFLNDSSLYGWECSTYNVYVLTLKRVARDMHGLYWTCRQDGTESDRQYIHVNVPVEMVEMYSPTGTMISVPEAVTTTFLCKTSFALPTPQIAWFADKGQHGGNDDMPLLDSLFVSTRLSREGFISTTSRLTLNMSAQMCGWKIYCVANNSIGYIHKSKEVSIIINENDEPSIQPPVISNFENGSTYYVKENATISLSCNVTGTFPLPDLTCLKWTCDNHTLQTCVSYCTKTLTVTWTVSVKQSETCACQSSYPEFGDITTYIHIKALSTSTHEHDVQNKVPVLIIAVGTICVTLIATAVGLVYALTKRRAKRNCRQQSMKIHATNKQPKKQDVDAISQSIEEGSSTTTTTTDGINSIDGHLQNEERSYQRLNYMLGSDNAYSEYRK